MSGRRGEDVRGQVTLTICDGCGFPVTPSNGECPLMWTDECPGPAVEGSHTVTAYEVGFEPDDGDIGSREAEDVR